MFKRHHQGRRSTNIVFVIFRLILSLIMFAVLLGGIYAAYKHFSGLDPLKLNPQAVLSELLAGKIPKELLDSLPNQVNQKVLGQKENKVIPAETSKKEDSSTVETNANLVFKFLIMADSHSDNSNLNKALSQATAQFPDLKFIIGLGDYTEVGTIGELKNAKKELDNSSLRYFLIPGDHDLWDCRNRNLPPTDCFREVFGPPYQSFTFENFRFILLNNSDNYVGFDWEQSGWITQELERAKAEDPKGTFVFLHEPLYHPSSDHVMGWVENKLKSQAGGLLFQLKEAGVAKIFSGDIHYFSQYLEPKTEIPMMTVGAVTIERNPQAPRFAVVSVFEDGSTEVEDIEIK